MEIISGIHQVDGVNANCYVVVGEGLVLIDTGLPNNRKRIETYIRDTLKRNPADLETIILTHFHIDHIGNVAELKNISGAKVAVHKDDADYIVGKKSMPRPKGVRGFFFKVISSFFKVKYIYPDLLLKDNDLIEGLLCIHTPGHTPGSICLYDSNRKILFVGDILRFMDGKLEGPPAQFTMNINEAKKSIKKISTLEFDTMLSGHGEPLMSGASFKVREFCKKSQ